MLCKDFPKQQTENKHNTDSIFRTDPGTGSGVVFRPKNKRHQNGYAQCVPVLVALVFGPENDPRFRDPFPDSNMRPATYYIMYANKTIQYIGSEVTFGMSTDQHNSFNVDN